MREALWPDCPLHEHRAEMEAYFTGRPEIATFVAVRPDGELGGFLEASIRPLADGCVTQPVGYIEGWYVDPDLRRQGVGARLVATAEAWARAQGCQEMASDSVIGNEVGLEAHKALGYVDVERVVRFQKWLVDREGGDCA